MFKNISEAYEILSNDNKRSQYDYNVSHGVNYSFFNDLDTCFDKISKVLKPNQSHCCFVVANRTVRREKIPTDKILVELSTKYDFKHIDTIYRTIANKAMAVKNAPENISNYSSETMNRESIVLLKY